MLRPTFSGFQVARRGLAVSQKLLDVTGQNITNVNTDGYTRQRVDTYSISYSSGSMQFGGSAGGIGRGVGDSGASQIRDPFLDIRYRNEAAKVGKEDVLSDALGDLSAVFDEISKTGLDSQFSNLITQLQALSSTASNPVIEGVVRTAASTVTQLFNHYAKQLDTITDQQISYLNDNAVPDVNQLMTGIAELNKQIKEQNIYGDKALELNDKRNTLIDELSTYMNIEVITTAEDIGNGRNVDIVSIVSKDIKDPVTNKGLVLINDNKAAQIDVRKNAAGEIDDKKNIRIDLTTSIDPDYTGSTDITESLEVGQLSGYLAFLNNKAEFTDNAVYSTNDRGIQYYEGMLNQVANRFAQAFNDANATDADEDGVNDTFHPLFEADGGGVIDASNIKISEGWKKANDSYIVNTKVKSDGNDESAANDNILAMIAIFNNKIEFNHEGTDDLGAAVKNYLFNGTLQECFSHAVTTIDSQIKSTGDLYTSYGKTLLEIDNSRASTSGVSMDEEGINLLTYNKSYNAAARFMTTLDDALSTLINNTGRVGL